MSRVVLVAGPPCAGKTTYARRTAAPGDVVLDADVIGARAMRAQLARLARAQGAEQQQPGSGRTVWVIRCAPGPAAREALARRLGAAHVVLLVPARRILMRRAQGRAHPLSQVRAVERWLTVEAAGRRARPTSTVTRPW